LIAITATVASGSTGVAFSPEQIDTTHDALITAKSGH
jgi:hypothetical protein